MDQTLKKRQIKSEMYRAEEGCSDWPPEAAPEFLRWLKEKFDGVPKADLPGVRIEFSLTTYNEWSSPHIRIWHQREETDAELAQRLATHKARQAREVAKAEAMERAQLAELKKKYERDDG